MKRFFVTLIVGGILGVGTIRAIEYLNFQIPIPVATLPDGAIYQGDMVDGVIQGQGRMRWDNGDRYEGAFESGLFHGQGAYVTTDGRRYTGEFEKGQFTGSGTYIDDRDEKYEGNFKSWYYHGQGNLTDKSGDRYIGVFDGGRLNGEGKYFGKNGVEYAGEFEHGLYSGTGILTTAEGNIYQGEFSYGQYHGKGTLTYATPYDNIKEINGVWSYGELIQADVQGLIVKPGLLNETALYNQQELLEASWGKLEENDPGKVDLYFLGISGDGSQAVFRREIEFVQEYFDNNMDTRNKSIALINARKTIREIPLATTTSIKSTLHKIAQRMDPDDDILFIYMSSHGSREFEFSLKLARMDLPDLSAQALAEMLDDLPIRWKVIVVSACYSGGFIPPLQNDNTLIITAAASNNNSFGCNDAAEFTYFGKAYFKDALSQTKNFVDAFDLALDIIKQREAAQGYDHSQPQIHKPSAILNQLAQWRLGSGE